LINPLYAGEQPYTQAAFDQLQKQGLPILVAVHAEWCPTCREQAPIISKLLQKPEFQSLNALQINFDKQKEALKTFNVIRQSTLIVFKAGKEVGRSLGVTDESAIEALLKKAL
jgi:thiol-disulfide isomerase/thioredoxin